MNCEALILKAEQARGRLVAAEREYLNLIATDSLFADAARFRLAVAKHEAINAETIARLARHR
jgi:hypothetical protein